MMWFFVRLFGAGFAINALCARQQLAIFLVCAFFSAFSSSNQHLFIIRIVIALSLGVTTRVISNRNLSSICWVLSHLIVFQLFWHSRCVHLEINDVLIDLKATANNDENAILLPNVWQDQKCLNNSKNAWQIERKCLTNSTPQWVATFYAKVSTFSGTL